TCASACSKIPGRCDRARSAQIAPEDGARQSPMTESIKTRRVVVTGIGIVSCIGLNQDEVLASLREGRSGIVAMPEYTELGFRSQVAGRPDIDLDAAIDRKLRRFMGDGAAYLHLSMEQAIADAGLQESDVV